MRKTLFSATVITALGLSTNLERYSSPSLFLPKYSAEIPCAAQNGRSFLHYLSMETYENLKAYHVGLRSIFPGHQIPSVQDLLTSIRSHARFVGTLSQSEGLDQYANTADSFLIFEERAGHFYMAHAGGLRHFVVSNQEFAGLHNGVDGYFPNLNLFIESTISI